MLRWIWLPVVGLVLLVASCERKSPDAARTAAPASVNRTNQQVFQVKGVIVELKPAEKSVRIQHEAIPGYMEAMTMPFDVKDTNELSGLEAGDTVAFRMIVTEKEGWIDQIKKVSSPRTNGPVANTLPTNGPFRFVRDVEPLNVGDPLPDYHFTNHLGEPVSFSQFRGQALAFTFIFTRCPFPNFCPLMSNNFRDVQDALLKNPNAPTNWHLITISFDPEWDTPPRLKAYAERFNCDPQHWSFVTGDLIDITAIAEQVGEQFWRDTTGGAGINHNLRTVVVDARGRVQSIIRENKWKPADLVAEIQKAAEAKP